MRRRVLTADGVDTVMLDLRMVRGRLHGIARYALELARRLPALAPELRFSVLTAPEGLGELGPLELPSGVAVVRARAGFLSPAEQLDLTLTLGRHRPALFHATSFSIPGLYRGKLVVTLHDANHLAVPESRSTLRSLYYRTLVGPRSKGAAARLTVSEFSRAELARHLRLDPYTLQVIAPGVDAHFRPQTPVELASFRAGRSLPARFFLSVGNEKPYKNLALLARIADRLSHPLVLLAGMGVKHALRFPDSTVELGTLEEADLPRLYASATALLYPSRYEGFGLPALEAMACGTPVLAANAGALPEVVGTSGILLPAEDDTAWVTTAQRVAREPAFAEQLRQGGLLRAARASWDECARQTLAVYRRALA